MKKAITLLLVVFLLGSIVPITMAQGGGCDLDAPEEPAIVDMLGHAFPVTEYFAEELELCNEVDNITVNTQMMDSNSAQEQMLIALSGGGESPWAILHTTPGRIVLLEDVDALLPLNDLVEKYWDEYDLADIPQTAWDAATIDGNIYGVPFLSNTFIQMYRMDLFEEYELEPPTTYDEVIEVCQVLADEPSIDLPFTINIHAGWAWDIEYAHFIRSFGGQYLNEDNTPAFNSEAGIAGLAKMKEVIDGCMGAEGITYSIDDSEIGMETGRLAFINVWASRAPGMDDPEKSDFVGMIGFAPAPAPNPEGGLGASAWIDAYSIPATTSVDPDLAFQIIMEAVDADSQMRGADLGLVVRTSVGEAGAGGRELDAVAQSVANGVGAYPMVPAIELARASLGNWLPLVGTGELTPEEALAGAEEEYIAEAIAQGFIEE
jgi:multiple sugar transport system substrate-binding protein